MTASDASNLLVACIFYMLSSAGMSILNKLAVQALPLPVTLVCVQMSFTTLSVAARPSSIRIGSLRDALRWSCTVPLLFAAMLVTSMIAMEHNTLGTIVVFRNIAPLFTLLIERMFRVPMQVSTETVASLLTIVGGVVLYHYHTLGLSWVGLAAICCNMAFAVLERLMQRHLMALDPVDLSKPAMMLLNNACGLVPCGLLMLFYREPSKWTDVAAHFSSSGACVVLLSCLNGLAISYAGLRVQQLVTATTFMVLTNVNKFAVILFGVAMLGDSITAVGVLGVLLAIGGGLWYARARARMQELTDLVGDTKRDAESQKDQEMSEALLHSGGKRDEGEDHAARRV